MNFKQILENLIEFNTMLRGWLDDINSGELADETKSDEWNDGVLDALTRVQEELDNYGLLFDEDSFDDEYLDSLEDLNED